MKQLLYILLLLPVFLHTQIADESGVNWTYGLGNNTFSFVMRGAWNYVDDANLGPNASVNYKIQITKTISPGNAIAFKDSGLICEISIPIFKNHPDYACIKALRPDIGDYEGFFQLADIPAGNYSLAMKDILNWTEKKAFTVLPLPTTTITDSNNYTYTNQTTTL